MSEIDHEAAKKEATKISEANKWLIDNGFSKLGGNLMAYAYLEMVEQRDYWRTIVQEGVGGLPVEKVTTEAELQTQLAAERARVEALVGLVEECIDSIDNWGCAGSDEYRERHGLIEEIEGYKAQLATIMKGRDHA